uniref:WGS project CBMC000000000 data, contig CS3220_c001251 n=1 Tax=Fusarium pseudograminearum CS3220 TaxID=1318456 RepID=A0A096PCE5_FUSPS|nr:unnamed protein product [Fusarium pseudograminearum CS3220]CEG02358.1 unnamed protein product [Fusarium pseudograminearum CS3220]
MDAIAIIGFADQVFSTSLKMYAIISGASQFGEEQDMLFWKFQLECLKFKVWHDNLTTSNDDPKALDMALLEQGEQVRQVVVGALQRIYKILNDAMHLYDKYGLVFIDKPSDGMNLAEVKVLSSNIFVKDPEVSAKNAQKAVSFWKRCKWQIKDKEKFGALLKDLSDLNNDLNDIFPSRMRNFLSDVVVSLLISSSKVPALDSAVKALTQGDGGKNLNSSGSYPLTTKPTDYARASVEKLAAIKRLAEALSINDTGPSSNGRQFSVLADDPNKLKTAFLASKASQGGTDFPPLENGFYQEQPVLVEWKKYDRTMPYRERQIIKNRVDKLAIFLNKTKPNDFCIPECTAYLHVDDESKFAFLYRLPTLAADQTKWTTLRDVFDRPSPTLSDRCSLEGRYLIAQTLARSLLQFMSAAGFIRGSVPPTSCYSPSHQHR